MTNTADDTEYNTGLTEKGNGTPTSMGFWIYKIEQYMDLLIYAPEFYEYCAMKDHMLSIAKPITSVSGFTDFLFAFAFRYFGEDDTVIFEALSNAVANNDAAAAGANMGLFLSRLLRTETPNETSQTYYNDVGYIG